MRFTFGRKPARVHGRAQGGVKRPAALLCAALVVVSGSAAAVTSVTDQAHASVPSAPAAAAPGNPSLAGEWHLDQVNVPADGPETTPDSSANGADLVVQTPTQTPGRFGNALAFNAAKQDRLITRGEQLRPAQLTAVAWVKGSASPGSYKDILSQGGDTDCGVASYALYTGANGGMSFYVATSRTTTVNSAPALPASIWDGAWHAIAGTYDGSAVRLYVDGAEVGAPATSNGAAIDYALDDSDFEVGNFVGCAGFEDTGSIDEVRIYNRALSDGEVGQLQNPAATTPPELNGDPTTTHVDCMPASATVGQAVACTATVSDGATAAAGAPTGQVAFSSDSPGGFTPADGVCTLGSPMGVTSTCSTSYTAGAVGSGAHHVTAAFTSDATDQPSTGTATVTVSAAASPTPPPAPPAPPATVPPVASFVAPATVSAATAFTLNAGATSGASTLLWNVGTTAVSCNAATPNLTVQLGSATKVALTAFGPGGSSTFSTFVPVAAGGHPVPAPVQSYLKTAVCSGGSPTADVTANGGPPAGCSTNVIAGIISAVGCLTQVHDPTQVPHPELGILQAMLSQYQATPAAQAAGKYFCSTVTDCSRRFNVSVLPGISRTVPIITTYGLYLSRQPVRINGIDFTPLAGSSIAVSPGFARVVSSDALVRVGGVPIKAGQVNFDVSDACTPTCGNTSQPVASFDSRDLPAIGGSDFPFSGQATISFVVHGSDRYSEIDGNVSLPASLGGITVDGKLRVDNTNGITPESFHGHLDGLGYDDIGLTNVDVYFQAPNDWAFFGDLGIGSAQIRLAPTPDEPYNGIVFHQGSLDHAGATLDLSNAPPPIAPGVDLDKLSLSFSTNPSALRGSVTLTALAVADVTGSVVLAFPSASAPFKATPLDLPSAPAKILNQTYTSGPVLGLGGAVSVDVPELGKIKMGSGYLLYDAPGYIAAGGSVDVGVQGVLSISGHLDGEVNVTNRRFNLVGGVTGCVADICGSVTGVISSYGAGICAGDFGGGVRWSDFPTPHLYAKVLGIGVACKPTKFTDDHVFDGNYRSHLLDADGVRTLVVKRGQPMPEILLDGDSGAPNVTVTGPGGVVDTADGLGVHRAGGIIAIQSESLKQTVVGFTNAATGTYTVTPLPGPGVVDSQHATVPQDASVKGHVTGTGTRRVLHYTVASRAGERITFLEVNHGVSREIGTTTGGSGTLGFTTAVGPGQRTIIAQDSRYDIGVPNAQNLFVAHFSGPKFVKPGQVGKVKALLTRGGLVVSWRPATHAATYRVTLREKTGARETVTTRRSSIRIGDAAQALAGSVTVVAVSADGSRGRAASAGYRAAHAPVTRFLPFSALTPHPKKPRAAKRKAASAHAVAPRAV